MKWTYQIDEAPRLCRRAGLQTKIRMVSRSAMLVGSFSAAVKFSRGGHEQDADTIASA
jgi:hypothetical protein